MLLQRQRGVPTELIAKCAGEGGDVTEPLQLVAAEAGEEIAKHEVRGITPHIAQTRDVRRRSRVDGRTTRHPGYEISQRCRKKIEEIFGWMKTVGGFRKTRYRGIARTGFWA